MEFEAVKTAILRTLAFHEAWDYAPTLPELVLTVDFGGSAEQGREQVIQAVHDLIERRVISLKNGRLAYLDSINRIISQIQDREIYQPRKRRRARRVVRWLVRLDGVRFVALANTTALGEARDDADLDFFIIVKAGSIWTTRFFSSGVLKLMGLRPRPGHEKDSVCLSYFISDGQLDISSHALPGDDPYFRYWFLSLLPLYDDGVSKEFWEANYRLRTCHSFAKKWEVPPDFAVRSPRIRIPTLAALEKAFRVFQLKCFPRVIKDKMNKDTTVMVTDSVLKFHVIDNREEYRRKYQEICRQRGIENKIF